jgi:hypothetical protein
MFAGTEDISEDCFLMPTQNQEFKKLYEYIQILPSSFISVVLAPNSRFYSYAFLNCPSFRRRITDGQNEHKFIPTNHIQTTICRIEEDPCSFQSSAFRIENCYLKTKLKIS